jgi:NitT/TauT family transport system ATP-binding protein
MNAALPMVRAKNLSMIYPDGKVAALRDVSFTVAKGEFVCIIGPSGCGKSTLIKLLGDILEPTAGSVSIDGLDARRARLAGKFSFCLQNPVLLPWRTALANAQLPCEVMRNGARDPRELLRMFGLEGFEDMYPSQLSGGMKQRVALARALAFDPEVLLLDEPFAAVDELTRAALNRDLMRIWQQIGVTVFLVTHNIIESVFLASRVFVLSARPGSLKDIVEVPFARPRVTPLSETGPFQELVKRLREALE